jgi:hypothetical protein
MADKHFPIASAEAEKMKKQLKFNNWLLAAPGFGNAKEWVRPAGPGDTIHQRDEPETAEYQKGGKVDYTNSNPLPPEGSDEDARRKLRNRLNVNEYMQTREDQKMGGVGTSRDLMPGPPVSEPNTLLNPDAYSQGGRVKHGSSTVVTCKNK